MNISVKYIATELYLPFSLDEQSSVAKDPVKVEGKAQGCFFKASSLLCSEKKHCLWRYLFCLASVWTGSNSKENLCLTAFPVCRIGLALVDRTKLVTRIWRWKRTGKRGKRGGRGRGGWQEKDGSHNRLSYGEEENCRREKRLGEKQSECSLFRVDKVWKK